MSLSILDAYTLLRFSEDFTRRLGGAQALLGQRRGLTEENTWLVAASTRFDNACLEVAALLERAHLLPDLDSVREEYVARFAGMYVDALERVLAGITFHVNARAPIIEALFPAMKFPLLRKGSREVMEKYHREFEKRTKGSYVTRMLAQPEFAFLPAALSQVGDAYAQWQAALGTTVLPSEEAEALAQKMALVAEGVESAWAQAKLLAEAALFPLKGAFEDLALGLKPKKRGGKSVLATSEPDPVVADMDISEDTDDEPFDVAPTETTAEPSALGLSAEETGASEARGEAEAELPAEPPPENAPPQRRRSRPTAEA